MKILFVATRKNRDPEERELYEMDLMNEVLGFKRSLYDLGILTVAACTPERFEVAVRDEYLAPIDYDEPADLVALSAKTSCVARAYEVAREFRARGRRVVLGGIHASLRPEVSIHPLRTLSDVTRTCAGPVYFLRGSRCYADLRRPGEPAPPEGTDYCSSAPPSTTLMPLIEREVDNVGVVSYPMYPAGERLKLGLYRLTQ